MLLDGNFTYVPALRLKAGEYNALAKISDDVRQRIIPRFVLPPPKERDPEERRKLAPNELLHVTGKRVGRYWPMRTALIDPGYLFSEFDESSCSQWLPEIFKVARSYHGKPVPMVTLKDMLGPRAIGFKSAMPKRGLLKLAIRVPSSDVDKNLRHRIRDAMKIFGLAETACIILIDFSDADFSVPEATADVALAAIDDIMHIGLWRGVVFQGTNFPEANPAKPGMTATVPRNEWQVWQLMRAIEPTIAERIVFGDYCADSAKFDFGSGGGITPIPHFRYCTSENWLVVRGKADSTQKESMRGVSKAVISNKGFAGREFSYADDYIWRTANGLEAGGNPTIWREMNTAHHLTHVVSELGEIYGYEVRQHIIGDVLNQRELFDSHGEDGLGN